MPLEERRADKGVVAASADMGVVAAADPLEERREDDEVRLSVWMASGVAGFGGEKGLGVLGVTGVAVAL